MNDEKLIIYHLPFITNHLPLIICHYSWSIPCCFGNSFGYFDIINLATK